MNKTFSNTLTVCVEKARRGEADINVFDLMYETCLPYPELKVILDKLVSENELAQTDLKTYKFIGDLNRNFNEPEIPDSNEELFDEQEESSKRRRELIDKMIREEMRREYAPDNDVLDNMSEDCDLFSEDEEDSDPANDLSEFVIDIFQEKLSPDAFIEAPLHPLWNDKNEFMQACADHLIILMSSDRQMGRIKALKKARLLLSQLLKERDRKTAEVYEYIAYGLNYMSNYYYNKIRESLL